MSPISLRKRPTTPAQTASTSKKRRNSKQEQYVVERILEKNVDSLGNVSYFVKWEGYPDDQNSWIKYDNFTDGDMIDEYERNLAIKAAVEKANKLAKDQSNGLDGGIKDQLAKTSMNLPPVEVILESIPLDEHSYDGESDITTIDGAQETVNAGDGMKTLEIKPMSNELKSELKQEILRFDKAKIDDKIESVAEVRMSKGEGNDQKVLEALVVYKSGKKEFIPTSDLAGNDPSSKALISYYEKLLILSYNTPKGTEARLANPYGIVDFSNGSDENETSVDSDSVDKANKRPCHV